MAPLPIVEDLDVREDFTPSVLVCDEVDVANELGLECREEALGYGVVPTIAFATHARNEAVLGKHGAVFGTRILTSTIGVDA